MCDVLDATVVDTDGVWTIQRMMRLSRTTTVDGLFTSQKECVDSSVQTSRFTQSGIKTEEALALISLRELYR